MRRSVTSDLLIGRWHDPSLAWQDQTLLAAISLNTCLSLRCHTAGVSIPFSRQLSTRTSVVTPRALAAPSSVRNCRATFANRARRSSVTSTLLTYHKNRIRPKVCELQRQAIIGESLPKVTWLVVRVTARAHSGAVAHWQRESSSAIRRVAANHRSNESTVTFYIASYNVSVNSVPVHKTASWGCFN